MKVFFKIVFGGLAIFFIVTFGIRIGIDIKNNIPAPAPIRPIVITATQEEDTVDVIDSAALRLNTAITPVTAKAFIVKDITHNRVILEVESDRLMPIASLTKLVTAVVSLRLNDPNTRITVGQKVLATYGNTAGFISGETFTAKDLLYPLLMVSSNDAAEALARGYDRTKFIQAMNDFAQSIGMYHTYLVDPAGLSPSNVSSAGDLAILLNWISDHDPDILRITRLDSKTIRSHTWINPTHFLSWSNYLGGKNGYLPESDRTGAALFKIKDDSDIVYAVVVLNSKTRDADVVSLLEQVKGK